MNWVQTTKVKTFSRIDTTKDLSEVLYGFSQRKASEAFTRGRYGYICIYNPPNNFFGLSLDKTDHVKQNRTMVIRRFYIRASVEGKLLISYGKQKNTFCRPKPATEKLKKLVDNSAQRNTKKSTKYTGKIYLHSP